MLNDIDIIVTNPNKSNIDIKKNFKILFFIMVVNTIICIFCAILCCGISNKKRFAEGGAYYENINEISSYAVIDLTGTSWELNTNITIPNSDITYTINGSNEWNEHLGQYEGNFTQLKFWYADLDGDLIPCMSVIDNNNQHNLYYFAAWQGNTPLIFNFIGGTDATNQDLISWLQSNATQIQNSVTLDTPTIILRVLSYDLYPSVLIPYDSNVSIYVLKVNTMEYSIALNTLSTTTYNNSTYFKLYLSNNQNYIGALSVKAVGDGSIYLDSDFSNIVNTYFITKAGDFYIQDYWCFNTQTLNILDYYVECSTIQSGTWNNKCFSSLQTNTNIESITMVNCVLKYENVSSNIEISLNTENGVLLDNTTYYLDYSVYIAQSYRFENGSTILNKNFTSNETSYNNIVLTQSNYFVYNGSNNDNNYTMVVISNLTGQYMPTNSYNYLLISFSNNQSQYLYANDNFFKLFRIATQEDYAVISAENDRLIQFNENFTFLNLFGAVVDTQVSALRGMLNFTMFGVNFYNFFVFVLAMALLYFVVKFVRGNFTKKE